MNDMIEDMECVTKLKDNRILSLFFFLSLFLTQKVSLSLYSASCYFRSSGKDGNENGIKSGREVSKSYVIHFNQKLHCDKSCVKEFLSTFSPDFSSNFLLRCPSDHR